MEQYTTGTPTVGWSCQRILIAPIALTKSTKRMTLCMTVDKPYSVTTMSLRSVLFSLILSICVLPAAHGLCESELKSMQGCLYTSTSANGDAQPCVDCLAAQTPDTTALDCTVNYNFVCNLPSVCKDSCGDSCTAAIEKFGFCTSESFFQGCPQDCSSKPDSTPDQLQNSTCSVYYNKVISCLSANSGNSDAAESNSGTCDACVGANPPPSSGDCSAANDYACTVASDCFQDCGSVCNDELFTFLQCQGDDLASDQCTYDTCDDTGKPVDGNSGASVTTAFKISAVLIGSLLLAL